MLTFPEKVKKELEKARSKHRPLNTAHEAYAVLKEELDEFWFEVRKKRVIRPDIENFEEETDQRTQMLSELVQIAAMAQRTAEDLSLIMKVETIRGDFPKEDRRCTCHERDSSYVCPVCKLEGFTGHMEGDY